MSKEPSKRRAVSPGPLITSCSASARDARTRMCSHPGRWASRAFGWRYRSSCGVKVSGSLPSIGPRNPELSRFGRVTEGLHLWRGHCQRTISKDGSDRRIVRGRRCLVHRAPHRPANLRPGDHGWQDHRRIGSDVAIKGDSIAAIGRFDISSATRAIDASVPSHRAL